MGRSDPDRHDARTNSGPHDRAWVIDAIACIEADQRRSADTHLLTFPLPSAWGIDLYLKDESTHPTGSLKHRLARSLFLYGLCNGWIGEGVTIIEASSGSTAVSEAYFARMLDLPFVAVVPATISPEKVALIEQCGGRCHVVDDPSSIYSEAARLAADCGGVFLDQFTHAERATDWRGNNNIAESIFEQMALERHPVPAWVVVGAGTGGTAATIGRYIRYLQVETKLCVVDPPNSVFADYFESGNRHLTSDRPSGVEGIGRQRVEPSFIREVDRPHGARRQRVVLRGDATCHRSPRSVGRRVDRHQSVRRVPTHRRDARAWRNGLSGDIDLRRRRAVPAQLLRRRVVGIAPSGPRSGTPVDRTLPVVRPSDRGGTNLDAIDVITAPRLAFTPRRQWG